MTDIQPQPSSSSSSAVAASPQRIPRSVAWRVSLGQLTRHDRQTWPRVMAEQRTQYRAAKRSVLQAPDGSVPEGFGSVDSQMTKDASAGDDLLEVNNPLSLALENPWHAHFDKLAALEQIQKDVERAFPEEEERFHRGGEQQQKRFVQHVSSVLAVWSLMEAHQHVGYRQGMHELAGVCWLVAKEDAEQSTSTSLITSDDVEADTYAVFDAIMVRAAEYYAWKPTSVEGGSLPIHQHCDVVEASLASNDVLLSRHLTQLGISTSLFAIRWIRLLFLREVPLDVALSLWDALFDVDPSLYLADHVCVAMLQRIRAPLLAAQDNSTVLRLLLSYPATEALRGDEEGDDTTNEDAIRMLLDEARQAHRRHAAVVSGHEKPADVMGDITSTGTAPPSLTNLARGLYAQSLAPGLHRAINNVQRTVNAAYSAHTYAAASNADGFPPSMDALTSGSRGNTTRTIVPSRNAAQPAPPPSRSRPTPQDDVQAQLDRLRATNKQMSTTMDDVVRVMEAHWTDVVMPNSKGGDDQGDTAASTHNRQVDYLVSLTAMKHMRDVLSGRVSEFDPAAVVSSGESQVAEKKTNEAAPSPSSASSTYPPQRPQPSPSQPQPPQAQSTSSTTTARPSFGTRFPRTVDGDTASPPSSHAQPSHFTTRAPLTTRLSSVASRSTSNRRPAPPPASTSVDDPLGVGRL